MDGANTTQAIGQQGSQLITENARSDSLDAADYIHSIALFVGIRCALDCTRSRWKDALLLGQRSIAYHRRFDWQRVPRSLA